VLIFAYTIPAVFIALQLTGNPLPQIALGSQVTDGSNMFLLERLDKIVQDLGFTAYTATLSGSPLLDMFCITMALMVGTAGLPHVIVRFFTVPRVHDARTSAGWALLFIAILYTTAPAVGAMARMNLTTTVMGPDLTGVEYTAMPGWFKTWEKTGLLKFDDKNKDGKIQYYDDKTKNQAAAAAFTEKGWKGNELTVDRDIMVLANPEIAGLPNWVIALVAAGGIAAALSTAAGLLLVISSSISHDLLKSVFVKGMSEKSELLAGRIAIAGAILIAGYLGANPPGFVAQVVAFAFGLAASSLFPVILLGIFSKRMNKWGAIAGMLTGLIFTLAYIVYFKRDILLGMPAVPSSEWWLGISPEGIGTVGMVLNFVVAWVVAKMTAPPPEHIQHLVEDIRVPRGAGEAVDH
jgi:cation/acetate symporter